MDEIVFGTDGEIPLIQAIQACFPTAQHILCTRHLEENALRNFSSQNVPEKTRNEIIRKIFGTSGLLSSSSRVSYLEREQEILEEFGQIAGKYLSDNLLPTLKNKVFLPSQANSKIPRNWKNNNCESMNHKIKLMGEWKVSKLPALVERLKDIHESQLLEIRGALHGRGNLELASHAQHLKVTHNAWTCLTDEQRKKVQDSKSFGNVLVLDGIIQCSERDEFAYQEMIAHLPLSCHANPKKVLVVGGGDGGVVREVLKNPHVQNVVLCEIDDRVVEVSKVHLPHMAQSFGNPKLTVHIGDGVEYMKKHKKQFDVIITDAPDPIGAAKGLFEENYYLSMKEALSPNGIICCQGENLYLDLPLIKGMLTFCNRLFPKVDYAYTMMPTYTGGHIGFVLCSINPDIDFKEPVQTYTQDEVEKMQLKYYNSEIHRAAFVLPQFARKELRRDPVSEKVHDDDT
ncbi:hypothetical protein FSP39_024223 [Pinctada imbricata]|uniref:PABS domain-containing protein n=1 Tax=Pinctada imbricata TaxID=66713 RepID=A0AA89BN32_PINIB|nr:hypothetical protein FSP39_024223 [Pinctada imbricata]